MLAGCYTLHLYCDNKEGDHGFEEFPHQFYHEYGSVCRSEARKKGWIISKDGEHDLCPKCSGKVKNAPTKNKKP